MKRARNYRIVRNELKGTWNVCFTSASTGKPTSLKLGTLFEMTKAAAKKKAGDLVRNHQGDKDISVTSIVLAFRNEKMPERFSTRRGYESWIRNHILPKWGDQPLTELKARPVDLWLKSLPLSQKSRTHIRVVISRLWKFAMYAELVSNQPNPMSLVEIPKASRPSREPLTVREFQLFLDKLTEQPYRIMSLVSISLGLRISETLGLKWGDIDWLDSTLQISRGMVQQHEGETKTEESKRKMALDPGLLEELKAWRQATQFSKDENWMFASPVQLGRLPWSYPHVWKKVMEAAKAAGIGKLSPHDLRHTYRAWLNESGAPPTTQQLMMRHADIRTTMNYGKSRKVTPEMREVSSKIAEMAIN